MKQLFLGVALAVTVAVPAAATTFVRVPDASLVDQAGLVVVGTVLSRTPVAAGATDYRLRVDETLAGSAPPELVVRVPGGGTGALRRKVWGAPSFAPSERALLFLRPGSGGTWRVLHLFMGAFHELRAGARTLAVRDLTEVREVRLSTRGSLAPATLAAEPLRDFAAFASWVQARRRGEAAPDYLVPEPEATELRDIAEKATWFRDPDDGKRMRWFDFDTAGHVGFRAYDQGQDGLAGGGYSEFQTALAAWNAETQTPIDYRYDGTTPNANGLDEDAPADSLNTIVFDDPHNLIEPFSCSSGGVLAFGGPTYQIATQSFHNEQFHKIASADIVVSDGLTCFFADSPNGSKAAQELFAHELGHTLGLGHSCGDSQSPSCNPGTAQNDALMRAYVHDDARGAKLGSDDLTGIQSLYAPGTQGTVPAAPTQLTATAVAGQTHDVHLTWHDNSSDETGFVVELAGLGGTFTALPEVTPNTTAADVTNLEAATGYQFRVKARNAAGDSAYSNVASVATNAPIAPCVADADTLCLTGDRFAVEVEWETGDGETGKGTTVPLSADDSGLFWFFGASNIEMLIKVLNACVPSLGNRYWTFFAATTDVEFTTTVIDTQTGAVKVYFNPQGQPADAVTDTDAFATCP